MAAQGNQYLKKRNEALARRQSILQEGFGLLLLFLSAFLLLTLGSFHPGDPSFNATGTGEVRNLAGLFGAYLSDVLIQAFGYSSLWLVPLLGVPGFQLFRHRQSHFYWDQVLAIVMLVVVTTIFSSLFQEGPSPMPAGPGGVTGHLSAEAMRHTFGVWGSLLLLIPLGLLGFMLLTRFSIIGFISWTATLFGKWRRVDATVAKAGKTRPETAKKGPVVDKTPTAIVPRVSWVTRALTAFGSLIFLLKELLSKPFQRRKPATEPQQPTWLEPMMADPEVNSGGTVGMVRREPTMETDGPLHEEPGLFPNEPSLEEGPADAKAEPEIVSTTPTGADSSTTTSEEGSRLRIHERRFPPPSTPPEEAIPGEPLQREPVFEPRIAEMPLSETSEDDRSDSESAGRQPGAASPFISEEGPNDSLFKNRRWGVLEIDAIEEEPPPVPEPEPEAPEPEPPPTPIFLRPETPVERAIEPAAEPMMPPADGQRTVATGEGGTAAATPQPPASKPAPPPTVPAPENGDLASEPEPEPEPVVHPLPSLEMLALPGAADRSGPDRNVLVGMARVLEQKLQDFKVKGQIVDVLPGPVVTTFELDPAPGLRASRVIGLADDLARSISAASVRVVGNVPGKTVIGIEVPNQKRETVFLREVLDSDAFRDQNSPLAVALGSDIFGNPVVGNLAKMPHLLVAGTTGSGKSVAVNAMICSILFSARPEEVRFLMVDPKMLELSIYEGIPHLMAPVVTDVRKASNLLKWAVKEMEDRYRLMSELGVRGLAGYNKRVEECLESGEQPTRRVKIGFDPETGMPVEQDEPIPLEKKPLIVIVIDELADLMIQVGKEVEPAIARLAQMARAAGLHLIIATQRPSVDVITGLIKANFPTRLAFQVSSKIDSRTILDAMGADRLLGMGDGLYLPPGTSHLQRIHAPFVADGEVHKLVGYLKSTGTPHYDPAVLAQPVTDDGGGDLAGGGGGDAYDEHYDASVALVLKTRKVSASMIQRHFKIGYNRAARIVERMAEEGLVSEPNSAGKREVLTPGAGG